MANRNPTDMGGAFAGVPMCSRESCPSYDGKRCRDTGNEPGEVCVPEVRGQRVTIGAIAAMLIDREPRLFQIVHYCSICREKFATDDEVRAHQAECVEHPAVKARETLRADRDDLARRADVLRNETTRLRRLLGEALTGWSYAIGTLLDGIEQREQREIGNRIRKEAGL